MSAVRLRPLVLAAILCGIAMPVPATAQNAPMVVITNPKHGGVVSGDFRVQVRVHAPGGLGTLTSVRLSTDGGTSWTVTPTVNARYEVGADAAAYETILSLAPGTYELAARAVGAATTVSETVRVTVRPAGTGDGHLLVRDDSGQLCSDCHAIATHSSQATSTRYGAWGFDCRRCHAPHGTKNIFLVNEAIRTPSSGVKTVDFRSTTGVADYSFATVTNPGNGICEVCHTRTRNGDGTPRFRNTGEGDGGKHYGDNCVACHTHANGFAGGESSGGSTCSGCHSNVWDGMNGAVAKVSRHPLGAVKGTNDAYTDSGLTWGDPLSTNPVSSRSCVNMCHPDHVHNQPGGTDHAFNVHQDARTTTSRQVARSPDGAIASGTPADTDFSAAAAGGGMCVSCHQSPIAAGRPAIAQAAYDQSAHDFVQGGYTQHDGSTFRANCTKCHGDSADAWGTDATTPFGGVHYSGEPSLLRRSPIGNGDAAGFLCFACHGAGTAKDIQSQVAKVARHDVVSDTVHDSNVEWGSAAFGNALGGTARHVGCLDCHDPHRAQGGVHATPGNLAGPSLEGAWGAELSSYPARWAAPTAANFTRKLLVAGTDLEASLCFKCHSSFYGPLPTSPSGGFQETDTAREFNPNNTGTGSTAGSFHPVLASAGGNLGATDNVKAPWSRTSLMTCSDCHASDGLTDPAGPHGSAAAFLLKGPNTQWNASLVGTESGMPDGTFCINCHDQGFSNTRFPDHVTVDKHRVPCFSCHSAIPHGTSRPGLLVGMDGSYGDATTDVLPYRQGTPVLFIKSYPADNTTAWSRPDCGCNGTRHR